MANRIPPPDLQHWLSSAKGLSLFHRFLWGVSLSAPQLLFLYVVCSACGDLTSALWLFVNKDINSYLLTIRARKWGTYFSLCLTCHSKILHAVKLRNSLYLEVKAYSSCNLECGLYSYSMFAFLYSAKVTACGLVKQKQKTATTV